MSNNMLLSPHKAAIHAQKTITFRDIYIFWKKEEELYCIYKTADCKMGGKTPTCRYANWWTTRYVALKLHNCLTTEKANITC
jgi:hypothetical protein